MTRVAQFVSVAALAALAPFAASASTDAGAYRNDAGARVTGASHAEISGETQANQVTTDLQNPYRNAADQLVSSDTVTRQDGASVPSVTRNLQPTLNSNDAGPAVNTLR